MTDLKQALVEIRDIRRKVAETTEFRGYGPLTLSGTAALAVVAGVVQARWVGVPTVARTQYVALWLATAVVSVALIATQMVRRANRLHTGMADEMMRMAVLQFLPAGVAGALLPSALLHASPRVFWMLPGLWQIVFSLGVFASCRSMPRSMLLVGVWFLLTGFACVALGDERALGPVTMSGAYAVGMATVAAIHFVAAKRAGDEEGEV